MTQSLADVMFARVRPVSLARELMGGLLGTGVGTAVTENVAVHVPVDAAATLIPTVTTFPEEEEEVTKVPSGMIALHP